jgi:hypothetical protein
MKKHSICDILAKQLASNFRQKYPDLRIEGHPAQNDINHPYIPFSRLIISNRSRDFLLQFFFSHRADAVIVARVSINANHRAAQLPKMRKSQIFELANPSSIDDLERWIGLFIKSCHSSPSKNSSDIR